MAIAELRMPARFRTCPVTGLRVHEEAERLIVFNAVAAVVFLLVGGVLALLIALTRWQAVHLLPADLYYRFLTAHAFNMLIYWIVFFEIAGLYFGGAVVLNARLVQPTIAWVAFALMVIGAVMTNAIIFMGQADVMFTSYVPLKANPLFYLGTILFAVGALIGIALFFGSVVVAKVEGRYEGSLPLVVFGLVTAAIIATYTLLEGAIIMIPTFIWSLNIGLVKDIDPAYYRNFFWGFGHSAQQINLAAMVSIWYLLATLTVGAKPLNEKLSRLAFLFYILAIDLGSMHHLLDDPALSFLSKMFNTSYAFYMAVLGSMIHAFSIPSAVEVALRKQGHNKGLFEWLRKAPWKEPGFSSLILSITMFGFFAGTTGVIQGSLQLSTMRHNTLFIPGHFHATVVAGTTVAFMGVAYYVIQLVARREIVGKRIAQWQPYVYSTGLLILIFGMTFAGVLGAPRRSWDVISFGGAPLAGVGVLPNTISLPLAMIGIGGIIAVIGGAMFVGVAVASIFFGTRREMRAVSIFDA